MPSELVRVLRDRQIDGSAHRSYRIDGASIDAADVLLAMESSHVQKITAIRPEALDKALPLKEAAMAMAALPPGPVSLDQLLQYVQQHRDPRSYLGATWDVADPYGRRIKAYRRAVEEIDQLVAQVFGRLD